MGMKKKQTMVLLTGAVRYKITINYPSFMGIRKKWTMCWVCVNFVEKIKLSCN